MNIVMWADLQCPFCYVGEKNLENAIKELGLEDQVKMDIKSYEIHREEDGNGDQKMLDIFQKKDGFSLEGAKKQINKINNMAKEEASEIIDFACVHESNDRDAHRLYKLARDLGKDKEFRQALHEAYFKKEEILSDWKVLLKLAEETGLDHEKAQQALEEKWYENEILNDEMEFDALKLESVPYFIINQTIVPEHLTKEEFIKILKEQM